MMKYLNQFLSFGCDAFFCGKVLQSVACGPLSDYTSKQTSGSKLTAVIVKDETEYHAKSGEIASNLYEKLTIKVPGKMLNVAPGTVVELVNPTAVVYGEYRNQLSVTAEDVHIVQPQTSKA